MINVFFIANKAYSFISNHENQTNHSLSYIEKINGLNTYEISNV